MKEYFCKVSQADYGCLLRIYIGMKDGNDIYLLRNNEMEKINPLEPQQKATLEFSDVLIAQEPKFLQSLVDGLINFGIKPSKPTEDTSQLKAVKYHLEDMRKIVFSRQPA